MTDNRTDRIRTCLTEALAPATIEVRDESHLHAGHPGAAAGGGHFHVHLIAQQFAGKPLLERHRLVYAALGDMMRHDIHALSLRTLAPDEA